MMGGYNIEMQKMNIEYLNIDQITPYDNNPRHNTAAVSGLKESITKFGFKIPMIIDKSNIIVCGHTRYKAAKELGIKEIPCIRANDLTEDQIKAFRIADNRVAEAATWDYAKLQMELEDISLDMSFLGFEFDGFDNMEIEEPDEEEEEDDEGYYGDERERTNRGYHLELVDFANSTNDFWQIPIIRNDNYIPSDLIGFNYAKTSEEKGVGIHFFLDDYQFERIWNYPEKYTDILKEYECILSPDFSLYLDMPTPMKIWNVYRSRLIGAYYQSKGIKVIPTISWAEEETYSFCFLGIPKGSVVAISTIGVKEDPNALFIWREGMREMIRQIKPSTILVYGGKIEFDYGDIKTVYFDNRVIDHWQRREVYD